MHFASAYVPGVWEYDNACDDVWTQHSWQMPEVASREHIAELIKTSTQDIENLLGYPVAPSYIEDTQALPIVSGLRRYAPVIETKWKKLIQFGQYTQTQIDGELDVVMSDADGDGFAETGSVMFSYTGDINELRFYNLNFDSDTHRLHPKEITQTAGTVLAKFHRWDLIKLSEWDKPPALFAPIDISTETPLTLQIAVYRKYIDPTLPQANLVWRNGDSFAYRSCVCGGVGCTVCGVTRQPACVSILDAENGYICLIPATYDADDGLYTQSNLTVRNTPTQVELFYTAGDINADYVNHTSLNPMNLYLEEAVTWMSAARLRFPICACGGAKETVDDLMRNQVEVDKQRQTYLSILSPEMLTNPFGTRYGEVKAWDRIARIMGANGLGGGSI